MAAEFYVAFEDRRWYSENLPRIRNQIAGLTTFVDSEGPEFRLLGTESRNAEGRWSYDVRLFAEKEHILVEVSAHPKSVEADLSLFFAWLRSQTGIAVNDEDGEPSGW